MKAYSNAIANAAAIVSWCLAGSPDTDKKPTREWRDTTGDTLEWNRVRDGWMDGRMRWLQGKDNDKTHNITRASR